jgi:hypothetical protein
MSLPTALPLLQLIIVRSDMHCIALHCSVVIPQSQSLSFAYFNHYITVSPCHVILILLSHHHIITSSHHHFITSSHHHIITSSHHHIITSSHHHIITSSLHHFITSSHHHIITSSHHHIITSSHHHIITSSHHHIITSSHHHIITSSPLLLLYYYCRAHTAAQPGTVESSKALIQLTALSTLARALDLDVEKV